MIFQSALLATLSEIKGKGRHALNKILSCPMFDCLLLRSCGPISSILMSWDVGHFGSKIMTPYERHHDV